MSRYIDRELDDLGQIVAIAIDGAKAAGKSETATRRADRVFFLDRENEKELVGADLDNILNLPGTTCFDEWQHLPPVWDAVRRAVDAKTKTRFLLIGSASPQEGVHTHSGAGRILSLRMRPLALSERADTTPTVLVKDLFEGSAQISGSSEWTLSDYARAICQTGFPGIYAQPPRVRRRLVQAYIQRAIDRDIPEEGLLLRKPQSLYAWWAAYAAASSTTTAYNKILDAATPGDSSKMSKDAALSYRDILTRLWLLDPIEAWYPNRSPLKKLTSSPKHQVVDPGIAASLLGVTEEMLVSQDPGSWELFGQLFESLATLTVRAAGQVEEANTYHLRTQAGRQEVDLILERYDGKIIAIEVKLKPTPNDRDVRHLHWLHEQIGERLVDKLVVTTGLNAYRRHDGVAVVPLALLG
ncbi:ATP-binding protein [Corynebacterium cystitidis]|uniref:ATP-binding protein n=1 Tax=Corynebacterium cystitidis TaxID=35757 RepID=UPI00211EA61D|nr:DUF4143 domain-containing protein [Corynebacterium cystitidis]